MSTIKTLNTRNILAGLNLLGLDKVYQQLDSELGMILTLHHVCPDAPPKFAPNAHLTIRPDFLEKVVLFLRKRDIDLVTIDEAKRRILAGKESKRFVVLTFDDGYRDNLVYAVPVLQKYDVPYVVYIVPGFIEKIADLWWEGIEALVRQQDRLLIQGDNGRIELDCTNLAKKQASFLTLVEYLTTGTPELNQRRRVRELCWLYKIDLDAILEKQIMTWDEVRQLDEDPLCTIGAHTLHHRALARLDEHAAIAEIVQGASILEAELGKRPRHLAYPYGYKSAAGAREFELTRLAKYETAVTTRPGMIFPQHADHLTALPRISLNGHFQRLRYFAPLLSGLPTRLSAGMKKLNVS